MCINSYKLMRDNLFSSLSVTRGGLDYKVKQIRANAQPSNWGNREGELRGSMWPDEVTPHSLAPGFFLVWKRTLSDVSCKTSI